MLQRFELARVVGVGDYNIDGNRYPWVSLTQFALDLPPELQESASGESVRFSIRLPKDQALPTLGFGDLVSGWTLTEAETKVVKGTDRSVERQVTRIVHVQVVEASGLKFGQPARDGDSADAAQAAA